MCRAPIRLVYSFVISPLFPLKGGCIVFSLERQKIAPRAEICDNVMCVFNGLILFRYRKYLRN